jgi:hypothetical protein
MRLRRAGLDPHGANMTPTDRHATFSIVQTDFANPRATSPTKGAGKKEESRTMSLKLQVRAGELVHHIRAGMSDGELMERYGLSQRGLQKLFEKLLEAKAISRRELYAKSALFRKRLDDFQTRTARRVELSVPLWIHEVESAKRGLVRDISERGLRVAGIMACPEELKTFQLPVDMFLNFDPLLFTARCIWVETKGKLRKYWVGGYEIAQISENDRDGLRKFLSLLVLGGSGEWTAYR